jgi:hypothetical protein
MSLVKPGTIRGIMGMGPDFAYQKAAAIIPPVRRDHV